MITFKNVAEQTESITPGAFRQTKRNSISQIVAAQAAAGISNLLSTARSSNVRSPSAGREARPQARHQASYSLSTPATPIPRGPSPSNEPQPGPRRASNSHQRSVSIISMNSSVAQNPDSSRKPLTHRRSSTMTGTGRKSEFFLMTYSNLSRYAKTAKSTSSTTFCGIQEQPYSWTSKSFVCFSLTLRC